MKNEVTVNGITLTREQVEEALAELNRPEKLKPGERVQYGKTEREWLVLDPEALQRMDEYRKDEKNVIMANLRTGDVAYDTHVNASRYTVKKNG